MKKGLFLVVAIIAMVIMLSISVSAEAPIEEWQLVSSGMGTMTASVYEDSENGGLRLEIVSVPTRPNYPITMPNGINNRWASYADTITSLVVSEGTYTISNSTFANLRALKSVVLNEGLVRIDANAFNGCTSLTEIRLPSSVTTMYGGVFKGCTSLVSVELPQGIRDIGSNMFQGCRALEGVTIPDTVQSIGTYAFADCASLQSITIGSGVTTIYGNAFAGCQMLTSVYIPRNVTRVDSYAFRGCKQAEFYVEATEEEVLAGWNSAWNPERRPVYYESSHQHSYERVVISEPTHMEEGLAELYCAECGDVKTETINKIPHFYKSEITKPATHFEAGVRTYSCECGYSYTVTISIIPHSYVSEITREATHLQAGIITYVCSCGASYTEEVPALTEHTYDSTVTKEATHYEAGIITYTCECGSYYTVEIPVIKHVFVDGECSCGAVKGETPVEIWDLSYNTRELVTAFLYHDLETDGLYRLVISGNGRARYYNLPWRAYQYEISEVVFEDGVKYDIPPRAFENYTELRKVKIGNGIEVIRNGAFRFCEKLVSVEVTGTLRRIESGVFERCIALEEITGITKLDLLGSYAFLGCKSLKRFEAEYIREIQPRAFAQCTSMTEVNILGGVEVIRDNAFEHCENLLVVKNIGHLKFFGRNVFAGCYMLETIILTDVTYEFQPSAFQSNTGLKNIIMVGEIEKIPDFAFRGCRQLENVVIISPYPVSIGREAFRDCYNLKNVSVSQGIADVGNGAFMRCEKLTGILFSDRTTIIDANAFANCRSLTEVYLPSNPECMISSSAFNGCNMNVLRFFVKDYMPVSFPYNVEICYEHNHFGEKGYCEHEHKGEPYEYCIIEPTHYSIGVKVVVCSCGASVGGILDPIKDHEYLEWISDGNATHTRKCFCGEIETEKHTFSGNICTGCGLQKNVLVYDDIESITASSGFDNLKFLFDGLKNTTGLGNASNIEYYPTKDKDYICITLKDEVDLGGIIVWICGDKTAAKITVYDANNKKTGEGKVEFNGGNYMSVSSDVESGLYGSLPVNLTFFGTVPAKYIKIEAERLGKEGGLKSKVSEIELVLGTKLDLDAEGPGHTKIDVVLDIHTLNAMGIEITPEVLEKITHKLKEGDGLEVKGEIGQIILDYISMQKVSGIGGNVTIGINDITTDAESHKKRVFSITVNDENGNPILPPDGEGNGTLTLSFKYRPGLKKDDIKVVYRDENGKIEHMQVESYDPVTGVVQFKTNHLSDYEIYADGISNDGLLEGAFVLKGYSRNVQTGAISVGFHVNYDIIAEYEAIMEKTVDFGVVFASFEDLNGRAPFDENGNVIELENSNVITMALNNYEYTDYDLVLGDITEEYYDHSFAISAYAKGEDGMWYFQDKGMSDTLSGITFNEIIEQEIIE